MEAVLNPGKHLGLAPQDGYDPGICLVAAWYPGRGEEEQKATAGESSDWQQQDSARSLVEIIGFPSDLDRVCNLPGSPTMEDQVAICLPWKLALPGRSLLHTFPDGTYVHASACAASTKNRGRCYTCRLCKLEARPLPKIEGGATLSACGSYSCLVTTLRPALNHLPKTGCACLPASEFME